MVHVNLRGVSEKDSLIHLEAWREMSWGILVPQEVLHHQAEARAFTDLGLHVCLGISVGGRACQAVASRSAPIIGPTCSNKWGPITAAQGGP